MPMTYFNSYSEASSMLRRAAFSIIMLLGFQGLQAQTDFSFKVDAPDQARELQRDTIDNFISFSPVYAEGKTYLRWLVHNDRKDGVFIIERSSNGKVYEALGFKDRVKTDKDVNLFYSWVDDSPPLGYTHYRIMQVGTDNTFNYSGSVRLLTGNSATGPGNANSSPVKE